DYTQLSDADRMQMMRAVGIKKVDELLKDIPAGVRLKRPLNIPAPLSEPELTAELECRAANPGANMTCFLGAGAYDHFIPAAVDALASRSEFVTAYTPYQAEASQGTLQAFYEFQTMVCELTGMDVANASMYEGGSALAEAVIMAAGISGKHRVVVSQSIHPDYRQVVQTYLAYLSLELVEVGIGDGRTDLPALAEALDDNTACLVIQTPNFFGNVERMDKIAEFARAAGVLSVVSVDPLSLGVLKRPGEFGADIVVAEGQPLGIPLGFGGPWLGLMATRRQHMRRIPGRLIGRTIDKDGQPAYCLSLQTREQHIRREKATSNICSNQGLLAYRAAIYMAAMGPRGLQQAARLCLAKSHYAARRISEIAGLELVWPDAPFFKEFMVRSTIKPVAKLLDAAAAKGILAGVPMRPDWLIRLNKSDHKLDNCFLVAVTEKRTKKQIDELAEALKTA
ncbi:MAG: aminomethyl-transferring glycine dehydrogenase subunit GcvPA, partial [Phycisphaerae bacterium]|nr:aminomethyl-transferring glycine dehydrogenase subunit GcvPA [Phycisphaerae bacterium]